MASENELTIPELQPLNAQEMATDDYNGLNTLLYVIRGLDADRDRKMTFAEFSATIGQLFQGLKVYDDVNKKTIKIENGEVQAYNNVNNFMFALSWLRLLIKGDGFTFKANDDDGLEFTQEGASFKANETYFEYKKGDDKIYFDADGFKVTKGNISVAVNSSGLVVKNGSVEVFKVDDGVISGSVASIANATLNKIKAGDVVYNVPYIAAGTTAAANFDAAENWTVGQVKRYYAYVEDGPHSMTLYNELGESFSVSFNTPDKNTYQEFLCVGYVEVNGVNRAVLRVHK